MVDVRDENDATLLHVAAKSDNLILVRVLIEKEIEGWVHSGGVLLHEAIQQSSTLPVKEIITLVDLLLKQGVNVDVRNEHQATPLHVAAKSDNLVLVCHLVAKGADLEAENMHRATPLHNASREGFREIVSYLIFAGSNIDALTDDEDTPLHQAVRKNKVDNVKTLILAGANTQIKNLRKEYARRVQCSPQTKLAYHNALFEKEERDSDNKNKSIID